MFDTRRLEALIAVADRGSVSAAAHALGLTQPAVSHHLARLEEEAGVKLLAREPRGMRTTVAGDVLVARARQALAELERAQRELDDLRDLNTGRVEVRAFPTAFVDLLPGAMRLLADDHPAVEVAFSAAPRGAALAAVAERRADVAVVFALALNATAGRDDLAERRRELARGGDSERYGNDPGRGGDPARPGADLARPGGDPARPGADLARPGADPARPSGDLVRASPRRDLGPGLQATHLLDDALLAVLPRGHRLASRKRVSIHDLAREPWVVGSGELIRATLGSAGIEPRVLVETDDLLAAQGIVAAGLAVTLSPALALPHPRPDVLLKPLAEPVARRIEAVTHITASPAALALVEALQATAIGII